MSIRLLPISLTTAGLHPSVSYLLTLPRAFLISKKEMKAGLCDHYAVCVSTSLSTFEWLNQTL
jgi:hypothetical protein